MIAKIIDLLVTNEHFGVSNEIEIAKGKYSIPYTWKNVWYKIKRYYYYGSR
jgi:hypothetical protein